MRDSKKIASTNPARAENDCCENAIVYLAVLTFTSSLEAFFQHTVKLIQLISREGNACKKTAQHM